MISLGREKSILNYLIEKKKKKSIKKVVSTQVSQLAYSSFYKECSLYTSFSVSLYSSFLVSTPCSPPLPQNHLQSSSILSWPTWRLRLLRFGQDEVFCCPHGFSLGVRLRFSIVCFFLPLSSGFSSLALGGTALRSCGCYIDDATCRFVYAEFFLRWPW